MFLDLNVTCPTHCNLPIPIPPVSSTFPIHVHDHDHFNSWRILSQFVFWVTQRNFLVPMVWEEKEGKGSINLSSDVWSFSIIIDTLHEKRNHLNHSSWCESSTERVMVVQGSFNFLRSRSQTQRSLITGERNV